VWYFEKLKSNHQPKPPVSKKLRFQAVHFSRESYILVFSITIVYVVKHSTHVCRRLYCTYPPAPQFLHDQPFHKSLSSSITASKLLDWNDVDISDKIKCVEYKACSGILRGPLPRGLRLGKFHILYL